MSYQEINDRLNEIIKKYEHLGTKDLVTALMNDSEYLELREAQLLAFNPFDYTDDGINDALGKPRRGETMEDFKKRTQQ